MLTASRVRSNDMGRMRWLAPLLGLVAVTGKAAGAGVPRFESSVSAVTASDLHWSYRPGCPVGPAELRLLHLTYWGFDGRPHKGAVVVDQAVVPSVREVFSRLFAERFPIRRMEPIDAFAGSDNRSMAADNTSAFNCRYAVAAGPKRWSVHAYGEAIDVDPLENPYLLGNTVYPPAGRRYLDRSEVRPGMAVAGDALVDAFAAVGWQWGGRWTDSPDYQHFSANGG
jgi:D-alanyl-D-alanine carboxypeptidase